MMAGQHLCVVLLFCCCLLVQQGCSLPPCNVTGSNLKITGGLANYVNGYTGRSPQRTSWCTVSKIEQLEGDKRLVELMQKDEFDQLMEQNFPMSIDRVADPTACWLVQDGYITLYSPKRKSPIFTSERLEEDILQKVVSVRGQDVCYRFDPRLAEADSAGCSAYYGTDKGQLAPSVDTSFGEISRLNSFIFSNTVPQALQHKRVPWTLLERYTRSKAIDEHTLYAITGVTFKAKTQLRHGMAVANEFYKLLVWCDKRNKINAEYIFLKHTNTTTPVRAKGSTEHGMTVKRIEKIVRQRTGISYKLRTLRCNAHNGLLNQIGGLEKRLQRRKKKSLSSQCRSLGQIFESLARNNQIRRSSVSSGVLNLGVKYFKKSCSKTQEVEEEEEEDSEELEDDVDSVTVQELKDYLLKDKVAYTESSRSLLSAVVQSGSNVRLFDLINLRSESNVDISTVNFKLQNITYNCHTQLLDVHSISSDSLVVIPDVLTMKSAIVSLRINLRNGQIVTFVTGDLSIGGLQVNAVARYDNNAKVLLLRGIPKQAGNVNLQALINTLSKTPVTIPLPSTSANKLSVSGEAQLVKGGLVTVVVSGYIGATRVHSIFQKPIKSGKFSAAFAANLQTQYKLSSLLKKAGEVDLSQLPIFASLSFPGIGVMVSSNYITSSILPQVFCEDCFLRCSGLTVPNGFTAYTRTTLGKVEIPLKIHFFQSILTLKVQEGGSFPLKLLSNIPELHSRSLRLPTGLTHYHIQDLKISEMFLDTDNNRLETDIKLPGQLKYLNNHFTVYNMQAKMYSVLKRPVRTYTEIDGTVKIKNREYEARIARDSRTGKYILRVSFGRIPSSLLISKFAARVLPNSFKKTLTSFVNFNIDNAKLRFPVGTSWNLKIHLTGSPVIGRYKSLEMNALFVRQNSRMNFVQGFQFGRVNFATLVHQITRKNLRGIAILNQHLDTSVLVSPISLPGVRLKGSKLKNIPIVKGVSVLATLQWPPNCARDKFCAVISKYLGRNRNLLLRGELASPDSFTLSAEIPSMSLGAGVDLQKAALKVKVGLSNSLGIEGSIRLKNPSITMPAGLQSDSRGVFLYGSTRSCWRGAFRAKWLGICNFSLRKRITSSTTMGVMELRGNVKIGTSLSCTKQPITAIGTLGIDQVNPNNNFYYVQLNNKVTMTSLFKAFCIKYRLPRALADSGFPKGFLSSYSSLSRNVQKLGTRISAGHHIKGTLNILGLEAEADMIINTPKQVKMTVALSPLTISGGLIRMYASRRDRSRGPSLKAIVTSYPRRRVNIYASGFVLVLGIQSETTMRVTNTQYRFAIRGRMLNTFHTNLRITAKYGNIKQAKFQVSGTFGNDLFAKVKAKINSGLRKSAQTATNLISKAQRKVVSHRAILNVAIKERNAANVKRTRALNLLNGAISSQSYWQRRYNSRCGIRNCRYRQAYRCKTGRRCKKKRWWRRRKCWDVYGTCHRWRTNGNCVRQNQRCSRVRNTISNGLRAARHLVNSRRNKFNVANSILNGAQRKITIAQRTLQLARTVLSTVKRSNAVGTKSSSVIAKFGIEKVFSIKQARFNVPMSTASTGRLTVSMIASALGKQVNFVGVINLRDITSFSKKLGNRVIPGLYKYIS